MSWVITNIDFLGKKSARSFQLNDKSKCWIAYSIPARFQKDMLMVDNDRYYILTQGILFNYDSIRESVPFNSDVKSICDWISEFRGIFSGIIIDNETNTIYAFGNQTGDCPVFYLFENDLFCISDCFDLVVDALDHANLQKHIDTIAVNHLLSLGYIVENHTIIEEIKKIGPGEIIAYADQSISRLKYHKFNNIPYKMTMDDAIENVDREFIKAVTRGFEKDLQYGYKNHLVNLSGGLDCKMISFAAKRIGFGQITNNCYAKANSDEYHCVVEAEKVLNNDLIFMPLDQMLYVFDIEELIKMNYGLSIFAGSTQCNRLLSNLNFNKFGIEFNGMLGDVVIGSFLSTPDNLECNVDSIVYSRKIKPILNDTRQFENHELFAMYYRGFQGAVSSHLVRNRWTTTYSPFMDVDFMQFCLNIPLEYRCGHNLYWRWIYTKYPEIATIPTTTYNPFKKEISFRKASYLLNPALRKQIITWLQDNNMIRFFVNKNTMKPQDELIRSRTPVLDFMNKYFEESIDVLSSYPDIRSQLHTLYKGSVIEKEMALTVLAACKLYYKS